MKAQSFGKYKKGIITLEILISFAIFISCMTVVILMTFGNESLILGSELHAEALYKTKILLEQTEALSKVDFSSTISTSTIVTLGIPYAETLFISDTTACKKQATSTVTWNNSAQKVELPTFFVDTKEILNIGGDCALFAPHSTWNTVNKFASDTTLPANPTTIDVLNKIAYIGVDTSPFLLISDTRNTILGQTNNLFTSFLNGFALGGAINDIDVVTWHNPVTGETKQYAFLAMASSTEQLLVVNVTDIHNPVLLNKITLSGCVTGSSPQGSRIFYYGNRLYLTTKYTAGPEFHIFNITNPFLPVEIGSGSCKGFELGDTVNDFVVKDKIALGSLHRFVYMATDEVDKELRVFDVTGDIVNEIYIANQNLIGAQNGQSVFIVGNKLYFGRQSTPAGDDVYIFNIENPLSGLQIIGSQDIGTGITTIRVVGALAFLSTPKVGKELQVWNIADPLHITNTSTYSFKNMIDQGIDYENDFVYAISTLSLNFQIIYSP